MNLLTLFDESPHPRYRHSDPDTSRAAAAAQKPSALEVEIVDTFRLHRPDIGLTDDQLCRLLHTRHAPTVKTARSRLAKRGVLIDTGERRRSNRGRDMAVWKLAR
jgi:hypothetical protein